MESEMSEMMKSFQLQLEGLRQQVLQQSEELQQFSKQLQQKEELLQQKDNLLQQKNEEIELLRAAQEELLDKERERELVPVRADIELDTPISRFSQKQVDIITDARKYSVAANAVLVDALLRWRGEPNERPSTPVEAEVLSDLEAWLSLVNAFIANDKTSVSECGMFLSRTEDDKQTEETYSPLLAGLLERVMPQRVVALHQQPVEKGKLDVFFGIFRDWRGARVLYPTAFIELSLTSVSLKKAQSLGYAAALLNKQVTYEGPDRVLHDVFSPILGIILSPNAVQVRVYSRSFVTRKQLQEMDKEGGPESTVVDILLLEQNGVDWAAIVRILKMWNQEMLQHLENTDDATAAADRNLSTERFLFAPNVNVAFSRDKQTVWKVFDRRAKPASMETNLRSWEYYVEPEDSERRKQREEVGLLTLSPSDVLEPLSRNDAVKPLSCNDVVNDQKLWLLKCPRIEGKHFPSTAQEFVPILRQLQCLHDNHLVHGDIRLRNMIFSPASSSSCSSSSSSSSANQHQSICKTTLIDFDFMGVEMKKCYPEGFNPVIFDGARHERAREGLPMKKEHDYHALHAAMSFFDVRDRDPAIMQTWGQIRRFVECGELETAANMLDQLEKEISLCWLRERDAPNFDGRNDTGSLLKKKTGYRGDQRSHPAKKPKTAQEVKN